jgi:hypothetical protein
MTRAPSGARSPSSARKTWGQLPEGVELEQSSKAANHEANHAQVDEGLGGLLRPLVVLGEASTTLTQGAANPSFNRPHSASAHATAPSEYSRLCHTSHGATVQVAPHA